MFYRWSDGNVGSRWNHRTGERKEKKRNVRHARKSLPPIEIRPPPNFSIKKFPTIDTRGARTLVRFDFQELTLDYFFSFSLSTHWRGVSVTSPFGLRQSKLEQLPKKNFHVVENANRERTSIFICSERFYNAASLYRQINRYCFNVEQRTRVVGGEARLVLDWSFSRFDKKKKMYDINALCFIYRYDDDGLWRARHGKVETKVDFFSLYAVQVTINDFFFFFNPCCAYETLSYILDGF